MTKIASLQNTMPSKRAKKEASSSDNDVPFEQVIASFLGLDENKAEENDES